MSVDVLQTDVKCLVESGTGGVNNEKNRYPSICNSTWSVQKVSELLK
jgi:hypothetical protein